MRVPACHDGSKEGKMEAKRRKACNETHLLGKRPARLTLELCDAFFPERAWRVFNQHWNLKSSLK